MYNSAWRADHGSRTRGPPSCITRPAATFANCVFTIKITQKSKRLGILLIIFHLWPTYQRTITGVAVRRKRVGRPCAGWRRAVSLTVVGLRPRKDPAPVPPLNRRLVWPQSPCVRF